MEMWKPVPSYSMLEASSLGRVRRCVRFAPMPNGSIREYKQRGTYGVVRRANVGAKHSYRAANYRDLGNVRVHRAVCEAFHGPAPFPRAVVIHINEDAHDNRPENLRWGTQKENLNAQGFIAYCKTRKGENNPRVKGQK